MRQIEVKLIFQTIGFRVSDFCLIQSIIISLSITLSLSLSLSNTNSLFFKQYLSKEGIFSYLGILSFFQIGIPTFAFFICFCFIAICCGIAEVQIVRKILISRNATVHRCTVALWQSLNVSFASLEFS